MIDLSNDGGERSRAPSSTALSPARLLQLAGIGSFEFKITPAAGFFLSSEALQLLDMTEHCGGLRDVYEFIDRFVIHRDRDHVRAILQQLHDTGGTMALRYRVVRNDGGICDIRSIAVRQTDAYGNVCIVGTMQDATQERREEEDLRRMQEQFAQVARSCLLGEMSSGIAHELNQPLAAIATFAHAAARLLQRPKPAITEIRDILRNISAEALRAGDTIRRMRAIVTSTAQPSLVDLRDVLAELRVQFDAAIRSGVDLQINQPAELALVIAERSQLHHVIASLLQNAIEAGGAARNNPVVKIQVTPLTHEVEVAVEDNGPGVARDAVAHLFRPFFTTKAAGTGLGLASSRSIIEAHHGRIDYSTSAQGGARFFFRLPIGATERPLPRASSS